MFTTVSPGYNHDSLEVVGLELDVLPLVILEQFH